MDKILVIRLSSLGDVLLTTPAIRALARRFPFAKIDFLTKARFAPLLDQNPYISRILRVEKGNLPELLSLRNTIRKEYDLVVDLHRNLRSFVLTPFFGGPAVTRVKKYALRRMLFVRFKINLLKNIPSVPERALSALLPLGVQDDGQGLDFFSGQSAVIQAKNLLHKFRLQEKEPIALAPGSRWLTKRWPLKNFVDLILLLPHHRFVVMGETQEKALGEELKKAAPDRISNLIGETDLPTTGEILRRCRGLVTNDSGLMHLGCAVKIPVVALFGSTQREFGFSPFRGRSLVLERTLACRPCTAIGRDICKTGSLECLATISAKEVAEALEKVDVNLNREAAGFKAMV